MTAQRTLLLLQLLPGSKQVTILLELWLVSALAVFFSSMLAASAVAQEKDRRTLILLLLLVSIAVFSVLFVLPGDPAQIMLGINATPETLAYLAPHLDGFKVDLKSMRDETYRSLGGRLQPATA